MTTKVSAGDLFGLNDQLIKLAMPLIALVVDIYFICRDIDNIKWCRVNLLCLSFFKFYHVITTFLTASSF